MCLRPLHNGCGRMRPVLLGLATVSAFRRSVLLVISDTPSWGLLSVGTSWEVACSADKLCGLMVGNDRCKTTGFSWLPEAVTVVAKALWLRKHELDDLTPRRMCVHT